MNPVLERLLRPRIARDVSLVLVLGSVALRGATPANDDFAAAYEFPSQATSFDTNITGTLIGATIEAGEESVPGLTNWNSRGTIWWKWTCQAAGSATFSVMWPSENVAVGVFTGSSLADLVPAAEVTTDPFGVGVNVEAGVTYWYAVMMAPDTPTPPGEVTGWFNYNVTPPVVIIAPPANDNFADRIVLSGTNVSVLSTNTGATTESGENVGPGFVLLVASVWYSWTAPAAGVVYFSGGATNPDFRFSLGTYRGETLTALTAPTATADGGFYVEESDTFQLQVASASDPYWHYGGGTGFFTLDIHLVPRAPASVNDAFTQRLDITAPQYHFEGSFFGATNEPGEPLPNPTHPQTLWWRFVAPEDGLIHITRSAPVATSVAVYEGNEFGLMQRLTEAGGSRFRVRGGHEYSVQLASGPAPSGGFVMDTLFRSTTNDLFAGREHLEGTNVTYTGNFTFATAEPGEPSSAATNTVWATWTAPFTGRLIYNPPQSYQFQYMRVFTGADLASLQPVDSVRANPYSYAQVFMATADTAYQFQFSGGADDFTFALELIPFLPATNDDFAHAERIVGPLLSCAPRSVAEATMELGEPMHMGDGPQKSLWWKWQAPNHGTLSLGAGLSFVSNMVMAAYQGFSVEALRLVGIGTNELHVPGTGGETYYIAVAVAPDATADVMIYGSVAISTAAFVVPGNLLREPSWEGTGLGPQYWGVSGSLGGYVNEMGGCDGSTWPVLATGTRIWQDFPTIPGHYYRVRFAFLIGGNLSGCCGDAGVRVSWDNNEMAVAEIPEAEWGFWHSADYFATASNTTCRITFENIHRNLEMDAFSVVDMTEPPSIVTQPRSISALAGGEGLFLVGAAGSFPLSYQWYFNGAPITGGTDHILIIDPATVQDAGDYFVIVTNTFGSATSQVATLSVDAPTNATILVQPYGDVLPVGSYFNVSVVATGLSPLTYQWFHDGQPVALATNRNLMLTNTQPADAGLYEVRVQNAFSSVLSLPARLVLTNAALGGAYVQFWNRFLGSLTPTNEAPVFDIDSVTRLSGGGYRAQLYAGPSVEALRAVGQPAAFYTGIFPGIFYSQVVRLPNVPPGGVAYAQVRAWESDKGSSYEEARALGGKFGRSPVFTVQTAAPPSAPALLTGMSSFSLQSGLPRFTVGRIEFVERQDGDVLVWTVTGEAGFHYLVEKSIGSGDGLWRPHVVLTNVTGRVTFTDTNAPDASAAFYRARILD